MRQGKPRKIRPVLGITMGEPDGIGPEIVIKALTRPALARICRPWLIGDEGTLKAAARSLGTGVTFRRCDAPPRGPVSTGQIPLLQIPAGSAHPVWEILKTACALALCGDIDAVVTAPVRKRSLSDGVLRFAGHTEFFAAQCGAKSVGMMLVGGPLRVMLATTHAGIRDLPGLITRERIESAIRLAHQALSTLFGIQRPRIAVAALNPHAGEGGLFGGEESTAIGPAAEGVRGEGLSVSDPLPADTAFRRAALGEFDAVVAMYHDQALIPVKLLAFGKAVNLTVGLPFIRTSVDHGTADDLVGLGKADPGSLIEAIRLAARLRIRAQGPR